MASFNWLELISGVDHENVHVVTASVATGILAVGALAGRAVLGRGDKAIAPAKKLSIKGLWEAFTDIIVSLNDMVIGKNGRIFVPMFASIFVYILLNNLIGLVPGMTPATENINTSMSVGLFSFLYYNYIGIKENGILGHLDHFTLGLRGPLLLLVPFIFLLEIFSNLLRPFTLGLRLTGNMVGDHTVLAVFVEMTKYFAFPFYFLGLFVCIVQAFVFTLLSMVYVMLVVDHH